MVNRFGLKTQWTIALSSLSLSTLTLGWMPAIVRAEQRASAQHLQPLTQVPLPQLPVLQQTQLAQGITQGNAAATGTTSSPTSSTEQRLLEKLNLLEQKQQQLEQEIRDLRQQLSNTRVTQPSVTVPENAASQFKLFAEVLFLQPTTNNFMDFAIVDPGTAQATSGDVARVDYEDTTGIRFGLSYQPKNTAWDIAGVHTRFETDGRQTAERPTNGSLFATYTHPFQNDSANTASAAANLTYRTTDVELGYTFTIGRSLTSRVFAGVRFADISQDMTVNFDGRDFNQARVKTETEFTGFGPRVGGELRLQLAQDLSLFGRGAGMLVSGTKNSRYLETDNNDVDLVAQFTQERDRQMIPGLELALGINWQPRISPSARLNLALGYEYQHWFNVADSIRFSDSDSPANFNQVSNDLSVQGLFMQFGFSVDF